MCGIAGFFTVNASLPNAEEVLGKLMHAIQHRGPDDQGHFLSADRCAGLASTRLAILDLSTAGHQPMRSADGRFTLSFNGEIYNFQELRDELQKEGAVFRSHTDTEVILQLYERLGSECVGRLRGMFAFAIWDDREKTAFLARDPLGIKPLYCYHKVGDGLFAFASELRPLLSSGLVPRRLNQRGLCGYFRNGTVPEPETLIEGVRCLGAGSWLLWKAGKITEEKFWTLRLGSSAAETSEADPVEEADAVSVARAALLDSLSHHFVSDVPVGLFLSGGIDSTALLGLARAGGRKNLRTFSIGVDDPRFDESSLARRTAEHFGTEHTEWRLNGATSRELFDEFLTHIDQPSIDGFNTFAVSRLAHKQGMKVVLSGLGGDELFGGYPTFARLPWMLAWSQRLGVAGPLRTIAGRVLASRAPRPAWQRLGEFLCHPPTLTSAYAAYRGIYTTKEARQLASRYDEGKAAEKVEPSFSGNGMAEENSHSDIGDAISALELQGYMRNQLLRDSDVMSMANSLELRVPFVDHRLVETLARIPAKIRLQAGKQLLLQAVPEVPSWVASQPKRGFQFPFETWFASDWKATMENAVHRSGVPAKTWYQKWSLFLFETWWQQIA